MPVIPQTPTDQEQLQLELVNRMRMDPGGEASRLIENMQAGTAVQQNITSAIGYFGVDTLAFESQMAALSAAAPLAWNASLAQAADDHTQRMIAADEQSHQLAGEASLWNRISAAGYANGTRVAENVYVYAYDGLYAHAGFAIDWGYDSVDFNGQTLLSNWRSLGDGMQDPAGHRVNIMNPALTEIGIAMIAETNPGTSVGPYLLTEDFGARTNYAAQLLGVVITDLDHDSFYDIGEGMAGVTIAATGAAGSFTTTSWSSGGYQMELPPGTYTVTFSGAELVGYAVYNATIGTANVKLDAFARDAKADLWLAGELGPDKLEGYSGDDLAFGDGFRASYAPDMALQVYRLYQATLDRAPDAAGQADWTERLFRATSSLSDVAAGFVNSPEFKAVYGALSNVDFVELLYQNVLGREADAGGLANWVARLGGGTSRAAVVLGFSESAEFSKSTLADATRFTQERDSAVWADDIYRLYQATLDRDPDQAGFLGWAEKLAAGRSFLTAVSGFVNSKEFQAAYGTLDDGAFVDLLYQNVLGREADATGRANWLAKLSSGASREQVVAGFSQSAEFTAATSADLWDWVRAQGSQDQLIGGGGANDLWGGIMADEFCFVAGEDGSSRIHDFETWDRLQFTGFGYSSAADIRAHMTQLGSDVVFSDQGTSITLLHTQLATITDATLLF